jgi:sensor histidine kinase YesM
MNATTDRRRRWLMRCLVFGIWTFFGIFSASQAYVVLRSASLAGPAVNAGVENTTWTELLRVSLAECYIWGLLAVFIFRLGRHFPLERRHWLRSVLIHLLASVLAAVVQTALSVLVSEFLRRDLPKPTVSFQLLQFFFVAKFHQNVFIYWVILVISQALAYYRKYRERELQASQLEARLAEARLQVLKMQLHPHFLFNTLHAISALIHQDVEVADRMIARLGDLLRSTLENAAMQEVSLREEMDFIQPYLEIEQARLGPRLTVYMAIDPEVMDARVPNLILQPLVENAIRHGIASRAEAGRIEIHARREQDRLHVQICDDGPGLPGGGRIGNPSYEEGGRIANPSHPNHGPFKEGVGLTNTRARLQQLYGEAHRLELSNSPGRGLTVTLTLPFREAPEAAGPGQTESSHENPDLDRG